MIIFCVISGYPFRLGSREADDLLACCTPNITKPSPRGLHSNFVGHITFNTG